MQERESIINDPYLEDNVENYLRRIIKIAKENNKHYVVYTDSLLYRDIDSIIYNIELFQMLCIKSFVEPIIGICMEVKTIPDCDMEYVPVIIYPENEKGIDEIIKIAKSSENSEEMEGIVRWIDVCENSENIKMGFLLFEDELFMSTLKSVLDWAFVPHFVFVNTNTYNKRLWKYSKGVLDNENILICEDNYTYDLVHIEEKKTKSNEEFVKNNETVLDMLMFS